MPKAASSDTWISIDSRPPPVSVLGGDRKLLVNFRLANGDVRMGYYLGESEVHFLGDRYDQPSLLDVAIEWQPFNPDGLVEYERNA